MTAYIVQTFLACAVGTDRCQVVEIGAEGTLLECVTQAQPAMASWLNEHPGYEVRGRHHCDVGQAT